MLGEMCRRRTQVLHRQRALLEATHVKEILGPPRRGVIGRTQQTLAGTTSGHI